MNERRTKKKRRDRRHPGRFAVCPQCGTRNKARRAECASCQAPLGGVAKAPTVVAGPRTLLPESRRSLLVLVPVAIVAALVGIAVHRVFRAGTVASTPPVAQEKALAAPATLITAPPIDPAEQSRARTELARGRKLLEKGDAKGALGVLSSLATLLPTDPDLANAYGLALARTGAEDRAIYHLDKAVRLAPHEVGYRVDFARVLGTVGRGKEAAREYETILRLDPANEVAQRAAAAAAAPAVVEEGGGGALDLGGAGGSGTTSPAGDGRTFTNDDLSTRQTPPPAPSPTPR